MVSVVEKPSQMVKSFFDKLMTIDGACPIPSFSSRLSVIFGTYPGEPETVYFSYSQGDAETFKAVMAAAREVGLVTTPKTNDQLEYELLDAALLAEQMYNKHPGDPMGVTFEFLPSSFWEALEKGKG